MERLRRPRRIVSSVFGLAAVLVLSLSTGIPAQAATNATLGDLTAATPSANQYAGCVAAVLTGSGITFGSTASLGAELAAVWPTLPAGVVSACKKAVDTRQPQVCVNPTDPATCPAVGAPDSAALVDQALAVTGSWKLVNDGLGAGGYAQTPIPAGLPAWTPIATATGTFTTPASFCITSDCAGKPGLWTDCGPTSCGEITAMTVTVTGRTPGNAVLAHLKIADAFGHGVESTEFFGSNSGGGGCPAGDCLFNFKPVWNCMDAIGGGANCGGQTLTATFTFETYPLSPPTVLAQLVEFQLNANNLAWHANPACPALSDCIRYDDSRISYLDASSSPTAVQNLGATTPSAVADLASSSLGCLVAADVTKGAPINCVDVTGGIAPLVQTAHAPVSPAPPPTIAAAVTPPTAATRWEPADVIVTLTANDGNGPGLQAITYSATGAQPIPRTTVPAASAQVTVTADGTTTINAWATDLTGTSGSAQSVTVKLDKTPPAIVCAAAPTGWSPGDVSIACSASDSGSGLADPTQASVVLTTSVPMGAETSSAVTNSVRICDAAGNCTIAGPIGGIKVDRLAPSIVVLAPAGSYPAGQVVKAAYSCSDAGSGVAACTGTVAGGAAIDTAAAGPHTFTVSATDGAGNQSLQVVTYTVTASVAPPPICSPGASGDEQGDRETECEKDGAAIESIKTPKPELEPTPEVKPARKPDLKPTPRPQPKPTQKPTPSPRPTKSGGDKSNRAGDTSGG
jgi:hypothetical protein